MLLTGSVFDLRRFLWVIVSLLKFLRVFFEILLIVFLDDLIIFCAFDWVLVLIVVECALVLRNVFCYVLVYFYVELVLEFVIEFVICGWIYMYWYWFYSLMWVCFIIVYFV